MSKPTNVYISANVVPRLDAIASRAGKPWKRSLVHHEALELGLAILEARFPAKDLLIEELSQPVSKGPARVQAPKVHPVVQSHSGGKLEAANTMKSTTPVQSGATDTELLEMGINLKGGGIASNPFSGEG